MGVDVANTYMSLHICICLNSRAYGLTWGAVLMARQAADLGHDFDQCFYVLQDGAL